MKKVLMNLNHAKKDLKMMTNLKSTKMKIYRFKISLKYLKKLNSK